MSEKLEQNIEEVKEQSESQNKTPEFDYRKEREERIKNKVEKAFLNNLGVKSVEDIRTVFGKVEEYEKQIAELKKEKVRAQVNEYKLEVLKAGFDDEFVDYTVDTLMKRVTNEEDFSKLLKKFKEEHPRFLRGAEKIKIFNTSSNYEKMTKNKSFADSFNETVRRKISKGN